MGTIKDDENVILEGVEIWLNVTESPSGLRDWRGRLEVPAGSDIENAGNYQLVLDDGRSGKILVKRIEQRIPGGGTVHFVVDGGLSNG